MSAKDRFKNERERNFKLPLLYQIVKERDFKNGSYQFWQECFKVKFYGSIFYNVPIFVSTYYRTKHLQLLKKPQHLVVAFLIKGKINYSLYVKLNETTLPKVLD